MIIDSHTHIYKDDKRTFTVDDLLRSMDEAGIDYSMLIADGTIAGGTKTDDAVRICEENPKLKPIGCIEYKTFGSEQIETLINYLKENKIFGVKFYPGYEDYFPYNEEFFPFYEKCERLGKPVIFHTGLLMEGLKGKLRQAHPLNIDDVASQFPDLKIIMAHFGNPWIIDAAAVMVRNKNVYIDLSGYFEIFQPIQNEDIEYFMQDIKFIKNWVGLERCLFGTDWPLYSQKEYLEAVQKLPLTNEERDLVFWKNAKEIFNLSV